MTVKETATASQSPESSSVKVDKLESLKKKQAQIAAQIRQLEEQGNAKKRKEETRVKVLIGAATLADIAKTADKSPEAAENEKAKIKALLNRAIQNKKDREFLTAAGWL